jgi:hypothetical protein
MKPSLLLVILVFLICCNTGTNDGYRVRMYKGKLRVARKTLKIDHPIRKRIDTLKLKH